MTARRMKSVIILLAVPPKTIAVSMAEADLDHGTGWPEMGYVPRQMKIVVTMESEASLRVWHRIYYCGGIYLLKLAGVLAANAHSVFRLQSSMDHGER